MSSIEDPSNSDSRGPQSDGTGEESVQGHGEQSNEQSVERAFDGGSGEQLSSNELSEVPDDAWTAELPAHRPMSGLSSQRAQMAEPPLDPAAEEAARKARTKRRLRISLILFVLTFLSTTLVGSNLMQITVLPALFDSDYADRLLPEMARAYPDPPAQADSALAWLWRVTREGLTYSVPLMTILLCHEMGHYLMAVRHRVPASFPYFIPMPIPPLGTMGAVIFQGRGVANRRQMFDIAVAGPLAGLVVTLPVLYYGITQAHFDDIPENGPGMRFGDPLLVRWLVEHVLGPIPEGQDTILNGYLFAGWVGVFITALNLMPIGQLDGGHILYTLIGRRAHKVALAVLFGGIAAMIYSGVFSYALLLFLLMLMGVKHPPTANDQISLGPGRHVLGWATLAFLVIGFTPQPIILSDGPPEQPEQRQFDPERRIDLEDVDPNQLVQLNSERGGDAEQNRLFRPC